ncbi:MAG: cytochrome c oxidase assembly protein [Rhodobacterales bacterium 65-51]|jgi:cytochrome c oxidase assembly protein subunit 11|uniref:Cytochrome c oxidase assembly protein CtaG n=1 Tax=Gemmobacter nanjingensis TaxID=488454 RepID=A0ABQ3F6C6_9RHOB|nr:cytochrome c oxidase assembly protein [Gemmobacter nanjingensis]OJY28643.1 MAG: cytochrome c oxidase assembly protein [Rhodobacterales bacterium 65-51]GHC09182.1 cytochrome c oxidase assembly protein CtaG [Gemmobacter nanjingensis]
MTNRSPGRTAGLLVGVVLTMGALSFAAVPFYNWFCRVTGFAGTTSVATSAPDVVLDREILVRFDASKEAGMPWDFKPQQHSMRLKIGETGLAFYEAHNPTDRTVAGTASYNVTPDSAGGYFTKIACFCFTEQVLAPGETAIMPVTFYVDPEIVKDPEGKFVQEITLSYTFHETALPESQAALAAPPTGAVN